MNLLEDDIGLVRKKITEAFDRDFQILEHPAYWAGLLDSDGSVCVSRKKNKRNSYTYQIHFSISWINKPKTMSILKRFQGRWGGHLGIFGNNSTSRGTYKNSKPYIRYALTGEKARIFLEWVYPYVKLKKQQVRLCLELLHIKRVYGFSKGKVIHYTKGMSDTFDEIHQLCAKLNSDNLAERIDL
jgi:hypothetical protein